MSDSPYYFRVPKDVEGNVSLRRKLWRAGLADPAVAKELWLACSRDVLFYINLFVWTYDVMRSDPPDVPFITFPFQDEAILKTVAAIGDHDLFVDKSRDMGASWIGLTVIHWFWMFRRMQSFLLVSRNEDYVDKSNNPKSLFWKLDFILDRLPPWLRPRYRRVKLNITNDETLSVIDGESTTPDLAAGDRRTAIFLDEFARFEVSDGFRALAATQLATKCRIFNSTPNGVGNAHHEMLGKSRHKVRLHWSDWPEKAAGLYQSEPDGTLRILDKAYWRDRLLKRNPILTTDAMNRILGEPPEMISDLVGGYRFVLDGKLRSPYYDNECERTPLVSVIASELDIDYLGSGRQFFEGSQLQEVLRRDKRSPFHTGELLYGGPGRRDDEPYGFKDLSRGRMRLWIHPDAQGNVARDRRYGIGVDVSAGTGASNSCFSVGDIKTGEKVASFICPHTRPEKLADYVAAVGWWFKDTNGRGAEICWENQGPGVSFGQRLVELGYSSLYYHVDDLGKGLKRPGWYSNAENKRALLTEYGCALVGGQFINRDEEAVKECNEYVWLKTGEIGHIRAANAIDPSGAKHNHGDRVIADALLWLVMKQVATKREADVTPVAMPGSFAWRRQEYEKRHREAVEAGWQVE